jgi:hypothetical protein
MIVEVRSAVGSTYQHSNVRGLGHVLLLNIKSVVPGREAKLCVLRIERDHASLILLHDIF